MEAGVLRKALVVERLHFTHKATYNLFVSQFYRDNGGSCFVYFSFHTHVQLVKVFGHKH